MKQITKAAVYICVLITILTSSILTAMPFAETNKTSYWGYVDPDYILPMTGVGADYLWFSNADPSIWTQTTFTRSGVTYYGHIDLVNFWKPLFHTNVISFCFQSASNRIGSWYYKDKFETVLNLFGEKKTQVIVAHYPRWDAYAHCGSQALWNDWIQFTQDWKDDKRISAFMLYGEPVGNIDNGQGANPISWVPGMTRRDVARWFAELVKAIHVVDPDRVVIYPWMGLTYWNQYELFSDLDSTGIFSEPNTLFDIVHPYYLGTPMDGAYYGNPSGKPYFYEYQFITPWINKVGAEKCWSGETFMVNSARYETGWEAPVLADQKAFFVNMINVFVRNKVGWNLWGLLNCPTDHKTESDVFYPTNEHLEAIETSIYGKTYVGSYNPNPTPTPTTTPSPTPTPTTTPSPTPTTSYSWVSYASPYNRRSPSSFYRWQ